MTNASSKSRPAEPLGAAAVAFVVNGADVQAQATTLAALLVELGYGAAKVATAVNGAFVPVRDRGAAKLAARDKIEIVAPRQGG